jgi:hypothetical protein
MKPEQIIAQLDRFQANLFVKTQAGLEPAAPAVLSKNLLLIRGLLVPLVDKVAESEKSYRLQKAARLDGFLKDGMKRSPAIDALEFEEDLIGLKIETERIRNYMKYVDGLCTAVQSTLKQQTASDKNQY